VTSEELVRSPAQGTATTDIIRFVEQCFDAAVGAGESPLPLKPERITKNGSPDAVVRLGAGRD
jgi:hypothetical protein